MLQQYWSNTLEPYRYVSVSEFSERFKKFHVGRGIAEQLASPPPISDVAGKGLSGQDDVRCPYLLRCLHRFHQSEHCLKQLYWRS